MTAWSPKNIPEQWAALLRALPGYDPISTAEDCVFCPEKALHVISFFREKLRHTIDCSYRQAGASFEPMMFQGSILANLFGWLKPDGNRRFRDLMLYIPRKNGKTAFFAGIGLYVLSEEEEGGMEIYSVATDVPQAKIVFRHARGMVENNQDEFGGIEVYGGSNAEAGHHSLVKSGTNSFWRVLSGELKGKHGSNPQVVIFDELHEQEAPDIYDVMRTGQKARRQPLFLCATTADFDRVSICNTQAEYARQVAKNSMDSKVGFPDKTFLPVVYEMTKEDEAANRWQDPAQWKRVNPGLGIIFTPEALRSDVEKAKRNPLFTNTAKRLDFNITTSIDTQRIPIEDWRKCVHRKFSSYGEFAESWRGDTCYAGIDLSSTTDITALVLLFPKQKEPWGILPFFWIPEAVIERRETANKTSYRSWVSQKLISVCQGRVSVDLDFVLEQLVSLAAKHKIKKVGFDRWSAAQIMERAKKEFRIPVEPVGMGYKSMSEPSKMFERMTLAHEFDHGDNPVLNWMFGNTVFTEDPAGNIKPDKSKATEKIDGIVAVIIAIFTACNEMVKKQKSVYETRGIASLAGVGGI